MTMKRRKDLFLNRKIPGAGGNGIFLLLVCIIFLFIASEAKSLFACDWCGCKQKREREYLQSIASQPFKDMLVSSGGYDFFITVAEPEPDTYDIYFYIENSITKRPVHSDKEILFYNEDSQSPERFVLPSDIAGLSTLRYISAKPFQTKIKVSAVTAENQPISTETNTQIGSPKPSLAFIVPFGFVIIIAVLFAYKFR